MPKGYWVEDRYPAEVIREGNKVTVNYTDHHGRPGQIKATGSYLKEKITCWKKPDREPGELTAFFPSDLDHGADLSEYLSFH